MSHKKDIQFGEKVWIEPTDPAVHVPHEARLRGGVLSGQKGHPEFPPAANQLLTRNRVPKVTGPVEVVWSEWWRRRYIQKDIKFSSTPAEKPKGGKKSGGNS